MIAAYFGFVCKAPLCQETRENGFANLGAIREHYEDFHKRRYNTDIVKVPQRPNPDAETPEETVPDGQEFLDNPNRAEEDGAPELMYERPDTDEEAMAVFDFKEGGKVLNQTMD